jgi:hypothetical protein
MLHVERMQDLNAMHSCCCCLLHACLCVLSWSATCLYFTHLCPSAHLQLGCCTTLRLFRRLQAVAGPPASNGVGGTPTTAA